MDPITLTVIVGGLFVASWAIVYLWPYILQVITQRFVPFLRSKMGDAVADKITELMVWLDKPTTALRSKMLHIARAFKSSVLGIRQTYEKTSASAATRTTEQTIVLKNGEVVERSEVEEVRWEDIPVECREAMMKQNKNKATLDIKDDVEKKIDEAMSKTEIELKN